MSYTSTTSTSSGVGLSTSDGSSSSSYSITSDTTLQNSSPDDSDGLAAELGGVAIATGEDTLTAGSISAAMVDEGDMISLNGAATLVAASESSGGTASALADTSANVGGAEFLFTHTQDTDSNEQSVSGSTAIATSTTTIVAYDIDSSPTGAASYDNSVSNEEPESTSTPTPVQDNGDLDGNIAAIEFDAVAVGDDTLVSVDAFALAIDDSLSVSEGFVVLAVD